MFEQFDMQKYLDFAVEGVLGYAPKILGAIIVLIVGFKVVNMLGKMVDKIMKIRKIDPTVEKFLISLMKNILKALVFVVSAGVLGVEMSAFVAAFAAVGLAIGMALSGTLGHLASGVMILLFKPYKVGDVITTAGHTGKVEDVQIFTTVLQTPQGQTIIIPNSEAIGSSIVNMSVVENKRIDITIGIAYGDSIEKAKEVLLQVAKTNAYVLQDEDVFVGVQSLDDSAVTMAFRAWVKSEDALAAPLSLTEDAKIAFDATNGELNFPFPHRHVHLYNQN